MKRRWLAAERVRLLENGEAFFPAVFDAIRQARSEILLETFIVFEDKVGWELHAALMAAAARGVQIDVLVDGFGAADLTPAYIDPLAAAGVRLRQFDPSVRVFNHRLNVLRRMHRKIVVVDGERAFVGGINFSADHLADFGPQAKQDYAIEVQGPIVADIREFALRTVHGELRHDRLPPSRRLPLVWGWARRRFSDAKDATSGTRAMLVTRDNVEHHNDIERQYRAAIRAARKQVLIANAYFFPGYRLLRELHRAARRGVDVRLILQGEPDVPLARDAARTLYDYLQRGGVRIYEYCERPLHGKVAVVDDDWATVGSSNLDPLSLSLNLEANVVLRDRAFAAQLRGRLEHLMEHACREVAEAPAVHWAWWAELRSVLVFHFLRKFPVWARWLPRHAPRVALPATPVQPAVEPARRHHACG